MLIHSTWLLVCAFSAVQSTSISTTATLPTVLWHGLGDSSDSPGIQSLLELISNHTKAPAIAINTGSRDSTFFGNINTQLELVSEQLRRNEVLQYGFNAIGFSQGGQFLRAYVQRYNDPPVRSLITYGSQHSGIIEVPCSQEDSALCRTSRSLVRSNAFSSFVQNRIIPAQYYKGTVAEREQYLEHSIFLADINNERRVKNGTYKRNMLGLDSFVMVLFDQDTTVIPKESSYFLDVNAKGVTLSLNQTSYWHDLGLETLFSSGRLFCKTVSGKHMQLNDTELLHLIDLHFRPKGTVNIAGSKKGEQHSFLGL